MLLNSLVRVLIQVPGTLLQPTEDPIRELGLWSQTWHQICAPPLVAHPVSSWSLTCLSPPHCSDLRVSTLDPPSFLCSLKTLCSFPFWGPLYLHRMFFPHIASGLDPFFQALPSSNISSLVSLPGSSYPMFTSWFPYWLFLLMKWKPYADRGLLFPCMLSAWHSIVLITISWMNTYHRLALRAQWACLRHPHPFDKICDWWPSGLTTSSLLQECSWLNWYPGASLSHHK